jgi:hypothetical protein
LGLTLALKVAPVLGLNHCTLVPGALVKVPLIHIVNPFPGNCAPDVIPWTLFGELAPTKDD